MHLKVVQQAVVATAPCDAPLALTQLALIFTKRLWSRASSAERSPTCSTLTMLPLRPRTLMGEGLERSSVGNLTEVVRLPMVAVFFWRWWMVSRAKARRRLPKTEPGHATFSHSTPSGRRRRRRRQRQACSLMKLLHWCSVSPEGPSGLAAVRFNKPVRVSFLRVFPLGAQPFVNCPDIVAYVVLLS